MPHFVYDNTNLPFPKTDLNALPPGADPTQYVVSSEWNTFCQAVVDVKGQLRGAKWYGLEGQASDPNPAGITNYLWLSNAGVLTVEIGLSTVQLVPATRQVIAGTGLSGGGSLAADRTLSLETLGSSPAGSYNKANITVDVFGRVTAASSGSGGYDTIVNDTTPTTQRSALRVDGINLTANDDSGNNWTTIDLNSEITLDKTTVKDAWVKTHAAFAGSEHKTFTDALQTTNATPQDLVTIALSDNTVYVIEATVVARGTGGTERALYSKKALVYREGGGATIQGTVQSLHTDIETTGSMDATIAVSSNNVTVQITGIAATTINWVTTVRIQAVSGNA